MEAISPPDERRCERCRRVERWDEDMGTWVAAEVDGVRRRGAAHCVHEWNITGCYNPLDCG